MASQHPDYVLLLVSINSWMTFEEIRDIAGIPIDHSFLKYKKELIDYGYEVEKISMKEQTIDVIKTQKIHKKISTLY